MKITVDEPGTSLQNILVENIELDEVDILKTVIQLLELQHDHFQNYKYYAHDIKELILFAKSERNI